jgi:hypothetical protein
MSLRMEKYHRRFWAVYDGTTLLCVTLYKKGALSVIDTVEGLRRLLTGTPPPSPPT